MESLDETIRKVRDTTTAVDFMLRYTQCNRTADALREAPIEELIGLAESAEYYMGLADRRLKMIQRLNRELKRFHPTSWGVFS